jgi:predicted acylesterase/phospholipase RssA
MTRRRGFLAALGATALAPASIAAVAERGDAAALIPPPVSHALVMTGGGARGAYQAGLVAGLAARAGIADGQVLAPYGLVCGTSVGAINAWFVATGQYAALRKAWHTLAAADVIQLKSKYTTLERPHAFVAVRIRAALRLAAGVFKNETGVARSEPLMAWLSKHIDPSLPVLVPMVWAVTNLTTQSPEYFYRLPPSLQATQSAELRRVFQLTLGPSAVIREATDSILLETLLASAAIPVVFDPVPLAMADGNKGFYVDGGVASNASVLIARIFAKNIDVVLVDPPSQRESYANVFEIVMGAYQTMQRQILETEMRDVYFESLDKRARNVLAPGTQADLQSDSSELRVFFRDLPVVNLAYMRPQQQLPADVAAFDRQDELDATFAIGEADGARGFTPYEWNTFRL